MSPKRFLLIKKGENSYLQKGGGRTTFLFDEISAKNVMSEYEAHGIKRLPLDDDHHGGPALAWFSLELAEDGLYAIDVNWTEDGEKLLPSKPYISPDIFLSADNKVVRVSNASMTAKPRLDNAVMLVQMSENGAKSMENEEKIAKIESKIESKLIEIEEKTAKFESKLIDFDVRLAEIVAKIAGITINKAPDEASAATEKPAEMSENALKEELLEAKKAVFEAQKQLFLSENKDKFRQVDLETWVKDAGIEILKSFASKAKAVGKQVQLAEEPQREPDCGLSEGEKEYCKKNGVKPELFKRFLGGVK